MSTCLVSEEEHPWWQRQPQHEFHVVGKANKSQRHEDQMCNFSCLECSLLIELQGAWKWIIFEEVCFSKGFPYLWNVKGSFSLTKIFKLLSSGFQPCLTCSNFSSWGWSKAISSLTGSFCDGSDGEGGGQRSKFPFPSLFICFIPLETEPPILWLWLCERQNLDFTWILMPLSLCL